MFNSTLIIGLVTTCITSVLIGFSSPFLNIWLGESFGEYHLWLDIKLITLPFYASAGIFAFVYRAWNRVKFPAVVTVIIGAFTVLISYFFGSISDESGRHIAYILCFNALFCFIQTYVLGVYMVKAIYGDISYMRFVNVLQKNIVLMILTIAAARLISSYVNIDSWMILVLLSTLIGGVSIGIAYTLILNKEQKLYLHKLINR
ncbi:hypothetical protein EIM50_25905 [Pseudoxanthomonas sp. SGD-10]|nr:hypothetical protein EIM50_25905 [Pseudoxanthomonas sp. SGD-10]